MFPRIEFIIIASILLNFKCVKAKQRMLGSRDAKAEEFPFVGAIDFTVSSSSVSQLTIITVFPLCTSTTLTPEWSLTAGHCIDSLQELVSYSGPNVVIFPYIAFRSSGKSFSVFSAKTDIIGASQHPAYSHTVIKNHNFVHNDIGLLRTRPVQLRMFARLSALDYSTLTGYIVTTMGYGLTNISRHLVQNTLFFNKPLQVAKVLVVTCPQLKEINSAICMNGPCNQLVTICSGDSGGPVLHASGVVGVNSLTNAYCDINYRTFGARMGFMTAAASISTNIGWLSNQIKGDKYDITFTMSTRKNNSKAKS